MKRRSGPGKKLLAVVVVGLAVAGLAGGSMVWRAEIPPQAVQSEADPEVIAEGARLAAMGNCVGCHTASDGLPYAGGLPIETPFGIVYSTNITPDRETGIGAWSEQAYLRALREGVDRRGRHLYPVFPYDHFTRVTDADLAALYAWNMSLEPVSSAVPENALDFPFNLRSMLAGWKLLYLRAGAYRPDPTRDADWNRGAYLVEGLGHCAGCHTPRDRLGGPDGNRPFAGSIVDGWTAPALTADNPAPVPWSVESLHRYLRDGGDPFHGVAAGPMASVVRALREAPEEDIRAMAVYLASWMAPDDAAPGDGVAEHGTRGYGVARASLPNEILPMGTAPPLRGDALFAGACSACHHADGPRPIGIMPDIPLLGSVNAGDPRNLIQVVLFGIGQDEGRAGAYMPGFAEEFTDAEVAALLSHVRSLAPGRAPWSDLETRVRAIRAQGPMDGTGGGPLEGYSAARQP